MTEQQQAVERAELRAKIVKASYRELKDCPHCGGAGSVPGDRRIVHTRRGGFGADNDLDGVLAEFDAGTAVEADGLLGKVVVIVGPQGRVVVDL